MRKIKPTKKLSTVKRAILLLGYDGETNEPIMVNGKTRSYLDPNASKAEAELFKSLKLPKKALKVGHMTQEQKDLYSLNNKDNDASTLIMVHDTESPEYVKAQGELIKIRMAVKIVTFFDMDLHNEYEDGTKVTGWNEFNLKKGDYLGMAKYLIQDDGLALSEEHLNDLWAEIDNMRNGLETDGNSIYKTMLLQMEEEDRQKEALEKVTGQNGTE